MRLSELKINGEDAGVQSPGLEILNNLNILLRVGNLISVEQNTNKLLHFFPKSPELWTMLAKTDLALAKLDGAKLADSISCQLVSDCREVVGTHLLICERIGDLEEANKTIKR